MLRYLIFSSIFLLGGYLGYSQNAVGIGTLAPNQNAVLHVVSPNNNQGLLIPQLNTAQRLSIPAQSPRDDGLLVYDLSENTFFFWSQGNWQRTTGSQNPNQTLSFDPVTLQLSLSGGSDINLGTLRQNASQVLINSITGLTAQNTQEALQELKNLLDATSDNQQLTLAGTVLTLENGGTPIDLGPILPPAGSDDQTLTQFELSGTSNQQLSVNLEDDVNGTRTVNLHDLTFLATSDLTNTLGDAVIKNNVITNAKIASVNPNKIEGGGAVSGQVLKWNGTAWSPAADEISLLGLNSDDQTLTQFDLSGTSNQQLSITLEDDVNGTHTVDLHSVNFLATSDLTNTLGDAVIKNNAVTNAKIASVSPIKIENGGAVIGQVLKWDGTAWSPADDDNDGGPIGNSFYSVDPSDFMMTYKNNTDLDKNQLIIFESDNTFVSVREPSKANIIMAPVHLPHGSQLQSITIYYWDGSVLDMTINFYRKEFSGSNEQVLTAPWNSSGNISAIRSVSLNSFSNSLIDNENYSYRFEVSMDYGGGSADEPVDMGHRVYAIKIEYIW